MLGQWVHQYSAPLLVELKSDKFRDVNPRIERRRDSTLPRGSAAGEVAETQNS